MSIVHETLTAYLPLKRKTTPSGWTSFNAPCCIHNGDSADTRQRGGLISNGDGGISFHCFNCGFKASWKPGRRISFKMKRLMQWLNVPDDVITKVSLNVLETEGIEQEQIVHLPKFKQKELPEGSRRLDQWSDWQALEPKGMDTNLISVFEYMQQRNLTLEDCEFHWTPTMKDRLIIPFKYRDNIVGYTARKCTEGNPKYISDQQPGYVFNLDNQNSDRIYTVVVEGPFDALSIDAVALLGSEIKDQQALLINSLNTQPIVVPDRDEAGQKLIQQAIDLNWSVSMPEWEDGINDVSDAIAKYGRIYTLYSIITQAEKTEFKIKLRSKKWFI